MFAIVALLAGASGVFAQYERKLADATAQDAKVQRDAADKSAADAQKQRDAAEVLNNLLIRMRFPVSAVFNYWTRVGSISSSWKAFSWIAVGRVWRMEAVAACAGWS